MTNKKSLVESKHNPSPQKERTMHKYQRHVYLNSLPVVPTPASFPPNTVYSYEWLCSSMRNRETVSILSNGKVHTGIVNGIQAEDGSGRHWLVKMHNGSEWFYVRAE